MNERIKELLNVCGMPNEDLMEIYSDPNKTFYMEQFAELIIQECIAIAQQQRDPPSLNYKPSERFVEALKLHFSIKG